MTRKYTDEELLSEIRDITKKIGHPPSSNEMDTYSKCSSAVCVQRFGSWNDAIKAAGFEPRHRSTKDPKISDEELLNELERLAETLDGRAPRTLDMDTNGNYSSTTYRNRFGSWNKAVAAIGLEPRCSHLIPNEPVDID